MLRIGLVGTEIYLSDTDVDYGRFIGGKLDIILSLLPEPEKQIGEIILYCYKTGRYVELDENNCPKFW